MYIFVYRHDDQSADLYVLPEWYRFEDGCGSAEEYLQLAGVYCSYGGHLHECVPEYSRFQFHRCSLCGDEKSGTEGEAVDPHRLVCTDGFDLPVYGIPEAALGD